MKTRFSLLPRRVRPLDAAMCALSPLVWLMLLESFTRGGIGGFFTWIGRCPLMFLLNYVLLLGLSLMFTLIARDRARAIASLSVGLVLAVLGFANHYKLVYRFEPILLTDIWQLGDLGATVAGDSFEINYLTLLWIGLGFAALCALCCLLLNGRRQTRPLAPAALGLALLLALPPLYTLDLAGGGSFTDMRARADDEGSLYALIALENYRLGEMHIAYDESEVRESYRELEARAKADASASVTGERPNLIVILSEAFVDEAWLGRYLDLTRPLMPFYQELMHNSLSGRLYVPKIGGGTSETEFEVLTGMRSKYAINPYSMGLPPTSSLASVLRDRGYEATAIHWLSIVYYNRYRNLRMEGFDALYSTDTTTTDFERKGQYISDSEHFNAVVDQMEKTDERDFVYCITMQNHGGYAYDDFRKTYGADVPFTNKLSAESEMQLANYCWLLDQTDSALRGLIERLETLDEPTVVAYFGDHIPALGAEAYAELGVPTEGDESHWTPYFIWSSEGALSGAEDMRAYQLGARALELIGAGDDAFLHYVDTLRETGENEDKVYDLLCYDALFGEQYAYDEGGLSPANEDFQPGGRMELLGVEGERVDGRLHVKPILAVKDQAYCLRLNGRELKDGLVPQIEGAITLDCVMRGPNGESYNQSNALTFDSWDALESACAQPGDTKE